MGLAVAAFVLLIGVLCVIGLLSAPFQRVSRARVEKFARRQSLRITVTNGPLVIRYLATTRRWRGSGLLVGMAATEVGPSLVHVFRPDHAPQDPGINGLALFVGWFVGAVIAEWRVSVAAAPGRRRAAALEPRRLADYVPRPSRVVASAAWIALVAFELSSLGLASVRHRDEMLPALGWAALTLLAGGLLVLVGRRVLVRPQRYADADLIAADDAIRSRSLHVLAGCALAIAGYLSVGVAETLAAHSSASSDNLVLLVTVVGGFFAPALGFIVATATVPPIGRTAQALEGRPA